jgi:multiple sugar transport system permease protein
MSKPRSPLRRLLLVIVLGGITFWALFPFYWAFTTSLKPRTEVFTVSYLSIPFLQYKPTLDNWREELAVPGTQKIIWNSVVVAIASALLAVCLGSLAGYALARFRFGRLHSKDITLWFLGQNILPAVVLVVPFFLLMKTINLLDTRVAVVLANSTFSIPFVTIVMRAMFKELPEELEEAALVDGYTRFGAFRKIVLPLAAPAITAVSFIAWRRPGTSLFLPSASPTAMPLPCRCGLPARRVHAGCSSGSSLRAPWWHSLPPPSWCCWGSASLCVV